MSANPGFSGGLEPKAAPNGLEKHTHRVSKADVRATGQGMVTPIDQAAHRYAFALSAWSRSLGKRVFDIACVSLALPLVLPTCAVIGLAVRITSRGPVLFRQQRMGRHGRVFTIFKFRTMPARRNISARPLVTTSVNQRFTLVGPFLRRWKLDELPQLFNVLRGEMSLVGPRPKLPRHQSAYLHCRPGLTGGATIVFAREEVALATVPNGQLDQYYHTVVLPAKQQLDDEYMAHATFSSDLTLIVKSIFRHWDEVKLSDIPSLQPYIEQFKAQTRMAEEWSGKPLSTRVNSQPKEFQVSTSFHDA